MHPRIYHKRVAEAKQEAVEAVISVAEKLSLSPELIEGFPSSSRDERLRYLFDLENVAKILIMVDRALDTPAAADALHAADVRRALAGDPPPIEVSPADAPPAGAPEAPPAGAPDAPPVEDAPPEAAPADAPPQKRRTKKGK